MVVVSFNSTLYSTIITFFPTRARRQFVFGLLSQVAELERQFNIERTKASMDRIKKSIEKKGYYITKEGKKITTIGRPKGRKDNKPRRKSGYYLRHGKKGWEV